MKTIKTKWDSKIFYCLFDTYLGRSCLMFEILAQVDQYTSLKSNNGDVCNHDAAHNRNCILYITTLSTSAHTESFPREFIISLIISITKLLAADWLRRVVIISLIVQQYN